VSNSIAETDFFGVDAVAFSPLPGSKQEVATVAGIVPEPSMLLVDTSATEANFKALPLADPSVATKNLIASDSLIFQRGRNDKSGSKEASDFRRHPFGS
jgi:hypothetical protein